MNGSRGRATSTAFALIIAVGGAGVAGYLISRPQAPLRTAPPGASPAPTPPEPFSTYGYSAADDVASNQVIVFGGDLSLAQTWLWNGNSWKLAHPRTSPPGREDAVIAYDPQAHMVLLFGGVHPAQTYLGDTWGWDGTTWHRLDSGAKGPPPGPAAMAWDPAVNAMVLMPASSSGADTWTWAGTHWTDHRQTDPFLPTGILDLAYDPAMQVFMAVGFGDVVGPGVGAVIQTWTWSGAVWREIATRTIPSGYGILGLGWDPVTARLLLFGERPTALVPVPRWEWSGTDWTPLSSVPEPRIIEGQFAGSGTGMLLLVGELSEAPGANTPIDVWAWTGSAWDAQSK
jgi:hypothetical protein